MKTFLYLLILFSFSTTAHGATLDEGTALDYTYEITQQDLQPVWIIQQNMDTVEILETPKNESSLHAYGEMIAQSQDVITASLLKLSLIGLFIVFLILGCIFKPRLCLHPLSFVVGGLCLLFAVHLLTALETLRVNSENLRYYFLVLTT